MRTVLATLAFMLVAVPGADAAPQSVHKNPRFGYQFKPPKGWRSVALKTGEIWLTSKFQSKKSYFYTDPDLGYTFEHTPEVMCVAFIHENLQRKRIEDVEVEEEVTTKTITILNPYKDYEDFLDRTFSGGGWYVDEKDEGEHKGISVTKYEIKVEKLTRTGPKRIITWVYHAPDIDFALQTEVLENHYSKLKSTIDRTLKSFELIERSGELLPTMGKTADDKRITRRELTEGTPKERRSKRMESQKALHERAIASLPDDWDHSTYGSVLVLDHEQSKWAKRLGEHVEDYLAWIEKNFDYLGEGEYARSPIIRVCRDRDEERSFSRGTRSGGNWFFAGGSEVYTHKDQGGFVTGSEVGWVNRRVLLNWMTDRDEDLARALPEWLLLGLLRYVDGARMNGRKLESRVYQWDKQWASQAVGQGKATSTREIMKSTREEFRSAEGGTVRGATPSRIRRAESAMLVRFLLSKDAARSKQAKGLLERYIKTLDEVVEEIEKKEKEKDELGKDEQEPETEEEEDALAKARAERWRARERELIGETFERVFGDWTAKDWEKLDKAFFSYLK